VNSSLKLVPRTFPSRVADLGFTTDLPADWISHDLPAESVDVSDPTAFIPLAVITAPHAALIFAFAARPAHDNGTLHDWSWYHLQHQELKPRAIGPDVVSGVAAMTGEAIKDSEMGPMVVRFAFFEDGGRLVCLTFSAPELLADAVRDAWFAMVRSFRLETPRGSRFAIEAHADTPSAISAMPEMAREETPAEPTEPAPETTPEPHRPARLQRTEIEMALPEDLRRPKCRLADFALAEDSASLDPEAPINANLRDRGIGLVPHVVAVSAEARRARVAPGAIEAFIDVPFGWHVIDDGQRTLVFEPSGKVQINLDLIPRDDRDADTILDSIESEARDAYAAPEFARRTDGMIRTMSVRGISDGEQPLEQHHLIRPGRDDTRVVRARVTATPEESADAWILGTLILESCVFPVAVEDHDTAGESGPLEPRPRGEATSSSSTGSSALPAWWTRALELEAQGQLEAAESTIREGCPYIGFAASTAEMYRRRMNRLKAAGDRAGALDAFKRSSDFISYYASMATSGGEGAALSYERDQFRAQLVAEYGCDPEARCA
jgi:hypothetical protein